MKPTPNFNRIARPYRWLEYLTLGRLLEQTREQFLDSLHDRRHALLLGDGDGRFTARLLSGYPHLTAEAVDLSAAMLALLARRSRTHRGRLSCHVADARSYTPRERPDLLATHFFLDCLTQADVEVLVARLAGQASPDAMWLVSEFRIPGGLPRRPAQILVRLLYLAFRILTGLRTTHLPDHAAALSSSGFIKVAERHRLFGLLTSELWQR